MISTERCIRFKERNLEPAAAQVKDANVVILNMASLSSTKMLGFAATPALTRAVLLCLEAAVRRQISEDRYHFSPSIAAPVKTKATSAQRKRGLRNHELLVKAAIRSDSRPGLGLLDFIRGAAAWTKLG